VNPVNGRRDLDIPGSLRAAFGHKNLGVYLLAREDGRIAVGDQLHALSARQPSLVNRPHVPAVNGARRSFMCRGCYFIYEEAKGLPEQSIKPGTPFAAIPASWRCPDCGTDSREQAGFGSAEPGCRKPTTGTFGCCPCAASGHAAAAPPMRVMNSRRLMGVTQGQLITD
jgi:rubredoxin